MIVAAVNQLDFLQENTKKNSQTSSVQHYQQPYRVLITDDDDDVHRVSELLLRNFRFEDKKLEILHAYSTAETEVMLDKHKDIAVILLDIVMETKDAGLKIIKNIREEMQNSMIRIIVRTGQPGDAPEHKLVRDYDINDYKLKAELTSEAMMTSMYSALRSYRDLNKFTRHEMGLTQIIASINRFASTKSLRDLLSVLLEDMTRLTQETYNSYPNDIKEENKLNGVMFIKDGQAYRVIEASKKYRNQVGKPLDEDLFKDISHVLNHSNEPLQTYLEIEEGFIFRGYTGQFETVVFIETETYCYDSQLIELMAANFLSALNNYMQNTITLEAQKEILRALGETADAHFAETGGHIERVSIMMYRFALIMGYSKSESEMIKIASMMHDIGKIAIPDDILKKPGPLTDEEFNIMKSHTIEAKRILGKSNLPILQLASKIAIHHHERMDGSGYPSKLKGEDIPECARMMAIVDVYDALTNERVYKKAIKKSKAIEILKAGKETQFDGLLLQMFLTHIERITNI